MQNMRMMMAAAMATTALGMSNRVYGAANIEAAIRRMRRSDHALIARTSIAQLNRHTGKPHEHRREIARAQRRVA